MATIISQLIQERLAPADPFVIIDCGARGGGEGFKWAFLGPRAQLHGFDPDAGECTRLNNQARGWGQAHTYHPLCLGKPGHPQRTLHVTRQHDSSSLYRPAEPRLKRYKQSLDGKVMISTFDNLEAMKTFQVETTTLDEWAGREKIGVVDYVKLDVQGAELDILQGSTTLLPQVLGLEVEVEFSHVYDDQPLFADVDSFLRPHGFTFFNFLFTHTGHYAGRTASPLNIVFPQTVLQPSQMSGQLLTADALYLIDPLDHLWPAGATLSLAKYLKLITIAEACGQVEFAFELLVGLRDGIAPVSDPVDRSAIAGILDSAIQRFTDSK